MAQVSLGGGLAREQARQHSVEHSLDAITDQLMGIGYEPDPVFVERLPGRNEYKATAWGGPGGKFRAQAIGSNPVAAAQSLVRSIVRR